MHLEESRPTRPDDYDVEPTGPEGLAKPVAHGWVGLREKSDGDQPSRDIHIPVIANLGDDECSGVVVEMIPQGRSEHANWTKENLWKIEKEKKPVLVVGPLFYDSEHLKNPNCAHLLSGQPKRMSLWEVHPVIEFYVCKAGHACDPAASGDWSPLD